MECRVESNRIGEKQHSWLANRAGHGQLSAPGDIVREKVYIYGTTALYIRDIDTTPGPTFLPHATK